MGRTLKEQLIKNSSFEYWLHNGHHRGKGELQRFIDKLPAITNTIIQGGDLTLADKKIIYEVLFAGDDIKIMSQNWPQRMLLLQENLTTAQVNQEESNKLAVEALHVQVIQLLLELQNAFGQKNYNWAVVKESIIRNVDQSRGDRRGKRSVGTVRDLEMLLLQLKEIASL